MIRELVTTAAITGAAIGGAPVAGADPQRYDGDVPGMNYDASLGVPCSSWERFIFGRGPSGQAEACHFPPPNQFPPAETGYWVISLPAIRRPAGRCAVSEAAGGRAVSGWVADAVSGSPWMAAGMVYRGRVLPSGAITGGRFS